MKRLLATLMSLGLLAAAGDAYSGSCNASHKHEHSTKASAEANATSMEMSSIMETAKAAGTFNTLLAAVEAAGLNSALSGEGPFTVFAPTDEAFAALPEGTVESLLKDKEKLASILTYHVLEGAVKAEAVVGIDRAETLNGQSVSVMVDNDKVMIDNAQVVAVDIICSNGIIHIIDAVMLPTVEKNKG